MLRRSGWWSVWILSGMLSAPAAQISLCNIDPPEVVSDVVDGGCHDIAASHSRVWLAEGRMLAVLDPVTLQRIPAEEITYGQMAMAVEYEPTEDLLYVATKREVHVYDGQVEVGSWSLPPEAVEETEGIQDLKVWPGTNKIFVLCFDKLRVLDAGGIAITETSSLVVNFPQDNDHVVVGERLHVGDVDGTLYAFVVGTLPNHTLRDTHGVMIIDLDAGGTWDLQHLWTFDPTSLHSLASANQVQVTQNPGGPDTVWVACGRKGGAGLVIELDVNPAGGHVEHLIPNSDRAWRITANSDQSSLFVATTDKLFQFDLPGFGPVGTAGGTSVKFEKGSTRDMVHVGDPSDTQHFLWTAIIANVDSCINKFQTKGLGITEPVLDEERWWISSCDSGIAVPEFHSMYLATFGGVVRYDISNLAAPVAVDGSYQPALSNTEHITYVRLSPSTGYVATVNGGGGVDLFAVSVNARDPAQAIHLEHNPSTKVYANDLEAYTPPGPRKFVLGLVTDKSTTPFTHHLQAWDVSGSVSPSDVPVAEVSYQHFATGSPYAADFITVFEDAAIFGGEEVFLTVDLSGLVLHTPSMSIVSVVPELGMAPRGVAADDEHLYVGLDDDSQLHVQVYTWDPGSALVTGVGGSLTLGSTLTGRVRLHPTSPRLYVNGMGVLYEVSVANDPPVLCSTYSSPYRLGTSDCRPFVMNDTPYILHVKNGEAFSILDPE